MVVNCLLLSSPDVILCSSKFVDPNMVNLVFFHMFMESTCGLVGLFMRKDDLYYYTMIKEAYVCKSLAVFVHLSSSLCTHEFIVSVFSAPVFAL